MKRSDKIEIMSPAGSFETLTAAIQGGADSIYFGVGMLNMRARAAMNFQVADLAKIVKVCHQKNIKAYLTLNTLVYDEDLKELKKICISAKNAGVDAVIVSDMAAINYARACGLAVHISTQANVSNFEAVKFFSQYAEVIVLARELNLKQVKNIINCSRRARIAGPNQQPIRFELFVHGALCVAIAGKCQMSLALCNHSANRGDCLQICRRRYMATDIDTGANLELDNEFIMSPKDLSTITVLDKIIDSGVKILKIEGRGRSADYVFTTTRVYREAADSVIEGVYTADKIGVWQTELKKVFNRGLWEGGYYLGEKTREWSGVYGSQSTEIKVLIGVVNHYFSKVKVAEFSLHSGGLKVGDEVAVIGPTTGYMRMRVTSLLIDNCPKKKAKKGDVITVQIDFKVRKSDKLFVIERRKLV